MPSESLTVTVTSPTYLKPFAHDAAFRDIELVCEAPELWPLDPARPLAFQDIDPVDLS